MLKIGNIDKILAINSQDIEVHKFDQRPDYYEFTFEHHDIHSALFAAHMHRRPQWRGGKDYIMELFDGITGKPLVYQFSIDDLKDPFALLSYLKDAINKWDMVTNK